MTTPAPSSKSRTVLAALAAAALGVGTFLAVQTVVADPSAGTGPKLTMAQAAAASPQFAETVRVARSVIGQDAPDFELRTADGQTASLSDASGKVVLLDFWGTWCPPCRAAMPNLERLHREKPADAFQLYAINVGDPEPVVDRYMAQNGFTMPALLDVGGTIRDRYGVTIFPTTFIIGADGKVADVIPGAYEAEINAAVDKALAAAE